MFPGCQVNRQFSRKKPSKEMHHGPPFNQMVTSSVGAPMVGSKTKKSARDVSFKLIGISPEYISPMSNLTSGKEPTTYSIDCEQNTRQKPRVIVTFSGIVEKSRSAIRRTWTQELMMSSVSHCIQCHLLLSV